MRLKRLTRKDSLFWWVQHRLTRMRSYPASEETLSKTRSPECKNHVREAEIIAKAGEKGAVTVATNMAGRGVDIILGGDTPKGKDGKRR